MLRAKHMGFRSVRVVEVKAETTTPGEVRTTTDAAGARVSTSRARRTLPKLEFSVDEDGAILHGPQRGALPHPQGFFSSSGSGGADADRDLLFQSASFHALHMRDFPSPPSVSNNYFFADEPSAATATATAKRRAAPVPPMKECVLNDTRATTMAIKFDAAVDKFVCGSSIERFSGHTGVCRVLGSKKYPVTPHSLQLGDLLRIGSVGLVVCEINRSARDETQEALSAPEYEFLKEHYLSLPLQQTFHPAESQRPPPTAADDDDRDDRDDDDDDDDDSTKRMQRGFRAGETSDEGESEEDRRTGSGHARSSSGGGGGDSNNSSSSHALERSLGASGVAGKKFCYICYDGDEQPDANPLVAPCHCKGDTKYVHLNCLQRWNHNLDADGTNANQKVCAVTNTDGLDVCTICKATYLTSVRLDDGRVVSLLAQKLPPPYVTFAVVTQHETRNRQTALTNTRFQLSFANMPRNQQYLTIGRSTNNNMTLRYRTVSQLHAKIKFQDNNFFLYDALSSNGTMLFLSRPLELDWNKTVHVKIGRTILTLKSKKRWKWAGAAFGEQSDAAIEAAEARGAAGSPPPPESAAEAFLSTPTNRSSAGSPPPPAPARAASTSHSRALHRSVPNRFEAAGSASARSDPSAELASSPYAAREFLGRSHGAANGGARRDAQLPSHRERVRSSSTGTATVRAGDRDEMLDALLARRQQQMQREEAEAEAAVYYDIADSFADLSFAAGECDDTPLVVGSGVRESG
ncbi:hypothetical protein PybrP1_013217 [[Pythium] brassicae (nom. inval.)]|nr:hypothetical protein PybrP1_013217 [[Pythium] brassicae (nom. inval.)]